MASDGASLQMEGTLAMRSQPQRASSSSQQPTAAQGHDVRCVTRSSPLFTSSVLAEDRSCVWNVFDA